MPVCFRSFALILFALFPLAAQKSPVAGSWEAPLGTLRVRIHIAQDASGALTAKMDSPDQGAAGLPATSISFEAGVLKWALSSVNASFEGKLNEAGTEIAGTFTQGMAFPLTFKRWKPESAAAPSKPQEAKSPVAGSWEGPLQTPGGKLRVRIHITQDASGALSGKMDSPDQGAKDMPVSSVSFAGGVLKWDLKMANATFEGKLNDAGTEIAGTLTQGMPFPLTFKRWTPETAAAPNRPQEPKPPLPYNAEELTFPSKAAGVTLAGTLTKPRGSGPFPAVILITGSGPQDRDEALMGHRPFLVLSDHLTRKGIAVLRYDDRGIGKSTGSFATATTADLSLDAEGALDFLKTRAGVDPKKIGFAGHSEGGIIAPMVAARRADVAFIVLLAGTAVPGSDVLLEQGQAIAKASGATEAQLKEARAKQLDLSKAYREARNDAELEKTLKALLGAAPNADAQLKQIMSPWFRYFVTYDPAPTIEKVKCPVLAMNGEKDLQVVPNQNLPVLESALKKGGNKDFRIVRLPDLNHLFQTAKTGLMSEYGQIEETMSPVALDTASQWIRQHTGLEK